MDHAFLVRTYASERLKLRTRVRLSMEEGIGMPDWRGLTRSILGTSGRALVKGMHLAKKRYDDTRPIADIEEDIERRSLQAVARSIVMLSLALVVSRTTAVQAAELQVLAGSGIADPLRELAAS
jgi:hypothetical protein